LWPLSLERYTPQSAFLALSKQFIVRAERVTQDHLNIEIGSEVKVL